jgi:coronin-1B/1C/6
MASFGRESKFRHCVVQVAKRESCYENIKTLVPQNDVNGVAGNSSMFCYLDPSGSGSALGVLPVSFSLSLFEPFFERNFE